MIIQQTIWSLMTIIRKSLNFFCTLLLYLLNFPPQRKLMVFHWIPNYRKSSQASRTLLSILASLSYVIVWTVSACPLVFNSYIPLIKLLWIVLCAPITISITVTLMFHGIFTCLARPKYLSHFTFSLIFTLWSAIWQIILCDFLRQI